MDARTPTTHQDLFLGYIEAIASVIHSRSTSIHADCETLRAWALVYAGSNHLELPTGLAAFGIYFVDDECQACRDRLHEPYTISDVIGRIVRKQRETGK